MKERPILFSAPMVRALLAGTKTQTRRVFKLPRGCSWYEALGGEAAGQIQDDEGPGWWHVEEQRCPYGQPGDRLWVRESFCEDPLSFGALYRADGELDEQALNAGGKWRPSIHMPRWASRITLEVSGVRVERLQDINEADCIAEGCTGGHGSIPGYGYNATPLEHYHWLWNSINGPVSWEANPWVWVVEFKRLNST